MFFANISNAEPILSFFLQSDSSSSQAQIPVTYGQVFKEGHLQPESGLFAEIAETGQVIDVQFDSLALHNDGSVRHGLVSFIVPELQGHQRLKLKLYSKESDSFTSQLDPSSALSGLQHRLTLNIGGEPHYVDLSDLLESGATKRVGGSIVTEWHFNAPLKSTYNENHSHLQAYFHVRHYSQGQTRIDLVLENNWTFQPSIENIFYENVSVTLNNEEVYSNNDLIHLRHARWKKTFWTQDYKYHLIHDLGYLKDSKAIPNYDPTLTNNISETELKRLNDGWVSKDKVYKKYKSDSYEYTYDQIDIMGPGAYIQTSMPATGGRGDIGPLPSWTSAYLLSMDPRAGKVMYGLADLAGSWAIHYRDKNTGLPVSMDDYPYASTTYRKSDTYNPYQKRYEQTVQCSATYEDGCRAEPYRPDTEHQPSFAFVPYLLTGDYYYLEEMVFWANWNLLSQNPAYRKQNRGLLISNELRGQAWGLRSLAHAAYILPDDYPLKSFFVNSVKENIKYYLNSYVHGSKNNQLGIITESYTTGYASKTGLATWQDGFFTWAVGRLVELDFSEANELLDWKAKFLNGLMLSPDFCWTLASSYYVRVRDQKEDPFYQDFGSVYTTTAATNYHKEEIKNMACGSQEMADALKIKLGSMVGYADSALGYPSNLQPALAITNEFLGGDSTRAWQRLESRSVKPVYNKIANFAIVPRLEGDAEPIGNQRPTAKIVVTNQSTDSQMAFYLSALASWDIDGDPLTYHWSIDQAPEGSRSSVIQQGSATWIFQPDLEGDYTIGLTVSDGKEQNRITVIISAKIDDSSTGSGSSTPSTPVYPTPPSTSSVNFLELKVSSYGVHQDHSTSTSVVANQTGLELTGNSWKRVPFNYRITPDTMLEFDFASNVEGDIHGIGFDSDDWASPMTVFQLLGSQNWGLRTYDYEGPMGVTQHFKIPVGKYLQGKSFKYLVFANDHDVNPANAHSAFYNVNVYEKGQEPVDSAQNKPVLDLGSMNVLSYGLHQDMSSTKAVITTNSTIELTGNTWKRVKLNYTITDKTMLEFDFNSNYEGDIHGIGFDTDEWASPNTVFQLLGKQNWGLRTYKYTNQLGKSQRIVIPVGQHLAGKKFSYLVFSNDHDVSSPKAHSSFSNISLYESGQVYAGGGQTGDGQNGSGSGTGSGSNPSPTEPVDPISNPTNRTLRVGPNEAYKRPSEASQHAKDGDTVEILAGDYINDVAVWKANNLTIRGINGRPHVQSPNKQAEGKGIWVVKGNNTLIENIEISGADVPDNNGAAIRLEGANLNLTNVYLHHNENGLLTGHNLNSEVVIKQSEFAHNGYGDGKTHNIYVGRIGRLELEANYIHHAKVGHNVKSRAKVNDIMFNRIMDEADGNSSYLIDVANGGKTHIQGNILQQGTKAQNWALISYGAEGLEYSNNSVSIDFNTFVNDRHNGLFVNNASGQVMNLSNNLVVGNGDLVRGGTSENLGNVITSSPKFMNRSGFDYRLLPGSPAIDKARSEVQAPNYEYVSPGKTQYRKDQWGKSDSGALELSFDETMNPQLMNRQNVEAGVRYTLKIDSAVKHIKTSYKMVSATDSIEKTISVNGETAEIDLTELTSGKLYSAVFNAVDKDGITIGKLIVDDRYSLKTTSVDSINTLKNLEDNALARLGGFKVEPYRYEHETDEAYEERSKNWNNDLHFSVDYSLQWQYVSEQHMAFYHAGNHNNGRYASVWGYDLLSNTMEQVAEPIGGDMYKWKGINSKLASMDLDSKEENFSAEETSKIAAYKEWWHENMRYDEEKKHLTLRNKAPLIPSHNWDTFVYDPKSKNLIFPYYRAGGNPKIHKYFNDGMDDITVNRCLFTFDLKTYEWKCRDFKGTGIQKYGSSALYLSDYDTVLGYSPVNVDGASRFIGTLDTDNWEWNSTSLKDGSLYQYISQGDAPKGWQNGSELICENAPDNHYVLCMIGNKAYKYTHHDKHFEKIDGDLPIYAHVNDTLMVYDSVNKKFLIVKKGKAPKLKNVETCEVEKDSSGNTVYHYNTFYPDIWSYDPNDNSMRREKPDCAEKYHLLRKPVGYFDSDQNALVMMGQGQRVILYRYQNN